MAKKKSLAKVVDDCAVALQKLVRVKAAVDHGANGFISCVSCNKPGHWKEMDGGHFFSRKDSAVKIIEENIHPQCKGCNLMMGKGDTKVYEGYRRYMVDMYGEEFIEELMVLAKKPFKHDRIEVEETTRAYKKLTRELEDLI